MAAPMRTVQTARGRAVVRRRGRTRRRGGRRARSGRGAAVMQRAIEGGRGDQQQQHGEQRQSSPAARGAGRRRALCGRRRPRPRGRRDGRLGDDFRALLEDLSLRGRRFYWRQPGTRSRRGPRRGRRARSRWSGRRRRVVVVLEKLVLEAEGGGALEKSHAPLSDRAARVLVTGRGFFEPGGSPSRRPRRCSPERAPRPRPNRRGEAHLARAGRVLERGAQLVQVGDLRPLARFTHQPRTTGQGGRASINESPRGGVLWLRSSYCTRPRGYALIRTSRAIRAEQVRGGACWR